MTSPKRGANVELAAAIGAAALHDVRNLLAVAETSAHLAATNLDDRPFATKHLDRVRTKIRGAQELLSRCLAVARGEPVKKAPATAGQLFDDAADTAPALAGVQIRFDDTARSLAVHCERTLLGRALANLVDNAAHAVHDHGGGAVRVGAEERGDVVVLYVSDTGPGLDASALTANETTREGGSGLGLLIVRAIASAHGGTLELAPRPDFATTLEIAIPRSA